MCVRLGASVYGFLGVCEGVYASVCEGVHGSVCVHVFLCVCAGVAQDSRLLSCSLKNKIKKR